MFYTFIQNNSYGIFDIDKEKGITHVVIVEASNKEKANAIAQSIGLYFDGCDSGIDCYCCGDRWYPVDDIDKSDTPTVYNDPPDKMTNKWMKEGEEVCVHYKDGSRQWY